MAKAIKTAGKVFLTGGLFGGDVASGLAAAAGAKDVAANLKPEAPTPLKKPAVMPTPNADAIRAARRRRAQLLQSRSGRQSTLLSNTDTLG